MAVGLEASARYVLATFSPAGDGSTEASVDVTSGSVTLGDCRGPPPPAWLDTLARAAAALGAPHEDQRWRVAAPDQSLEARAVVMNAVGIITLLTDFGLDDPYVGVLKAVLLRGCPAARIVDLSHALKPYDTLASSILDRASIWLVSAGTAHLVVVDPTVGSARRALAIAAHGQFFFGPDNGVLTRIHEQDPRAEAREIAPSALGLASPSRTFHGRDVFAPAVAQLVSGSLAFDAIGDRVASLCDAILPLAVDHGLGWAGQVVTVDRFGNALTNLLPDA